MGHGDCGDVTVRADKYILSIFALATALAVNGGALGQPLPHPAPDGAGKLRPAIQALQPAQWQRQDPIDNDLGPDDQQPWRNQPESDAHEGDPRDDGYNPSDQPHDPQQPRREQDHRNDSILEPDNGHDHAPGYSQNPTPDLRQDEDQYPSSSESDSYREPPPDVRHVPDDDAHIDETSHRTRQQTLITLYDEAPPAASRPAQAPGPLQTPRGDPADVTSSIGPAPATTDTPTSDDAMRPVLAAPVVGEQNSPQALPGVNDPIVAAPAGDVLASAVMDQARAMLEQPSTFTGSRLDVTQQAQVRAFYAARATPLWLVNGEWAPAAKAAQDKFALAWEEGLEPADYPAPLLRDHNGAPGFLAAAEINQSINAVKYARDASGGRLDLPRLSRHITPTLTLPASTDVLATLASDILAGQDIGARLGGYNPLHSGYVALRDRLIRIRAARPPEPPVARVPEGPVLRVGMSDPRVTLVRSRLGLTPSDDVAYDQGLAAAVAEFQRSRGLKPTGRLTRQTVIAMAGDGLPAAQDETALVVNMERWRWLPRELGPDYIFVNIPEYSMRVVRDGALAHEARIVVGKAQTPTPVFSDMMQYAVINPYWNVPPSIMKKEFLPGLARDPNYATKRGYEVIRRGNNIHVRQPPGERNALGHIKFMFPNDHAVYLHDTPSRALFGKDRRAFSHGCVRVDNPMKFAELLLGPQWPQSRIRKLIGRGERTVRLPTQMPVHLAYFTASVDQSGVLHSREDIYGIDQRMRAALGQQRP